MIFPWKKQKSQQKIIQIHSYWVIRFWGVMYFSGLITFPKNRKAIYNWEVVQRNSPHIDFCRSYHRILIGYNTRIRNFLYLASHIFYFSFCLLFYLDGMFAVEKYILLLPRLIKNNMLQTNTYYCDEFLRPVYFQIKRTKKYLKNKFEIASISVFHYACFLGTLRFCNKSFAIGEDSNLKVICLKHHEMRKNLVLFFI